MYRSYKLLIVLSHYHFKGRNLKRRIQIMRKEIAKRRIPNLVSIGNFIDSNPVGT